MNHPTLSTSALKPWLWTTYICSEPVEQTQGSHTGPGDVLQQAAHGFRTLLNTENIYTEENRGNLVTVPDGFTSWDTGTKEEWP